MPIMQEPCSGFMKTDSAGKVIASEYTLQVIPGKIKGAKTLEKLGKPLKKIRLEKGLSFIWGRSGHCIGSVWLEFSLQGKKILFTGDYTEKSSAYRCDAIRRRKAETAVIDCAYGNEETGAADHLLALGRGIDEAAASGKAMLFRCRCTGGALTSSGCFRNGESRSI
jgi:Cft2 family RNA processing exonuclease